MKENPNIEELLNSFIDGELTERQRTEVQRLISHDRRIAQRLRELEKCKMLVGSLPRAEAPAEMAEQIKASLEERTLLDRQPERFDERKGARHLLVRKVLAAAAMIGLVAILAAVIYTIVAPERGIERPVAVKDWQQPAIKSKAAKPEPSIVATIEKPVDKAMLAATGFSGRIELKTSAPVAVDAFINREIEDNDLLDCISSKAEGGRSEYSLSCSPDGLNLLLADLENIWARFDSARLFVKTDRVGGEVVVDGVSTEQIAEIVNQDSFQRRIKVARDFAVLNSMAELLPAKEILAAVDDRRGDLITIPKPVLTSAVRRPAESEKTIKKPASRAGREMQVHLTIVVVGGE